MMQADVVHPDYSRKNFLQILVTINFGNTNTHIGKTNQIDQINQIGVIAERAW